MAKRGRPKTKSVSIEDILHKEHVECLRQAQRARELLSQQVHELKQRAEQNPSMTTKDRMEVISGIGEVYTKLIRAAEIAGKGKRDSSGDGDGEMTLEELVK